MTDGKPHPVDAAALRDIFEEITREVLLVSPGRAMQVVIARDREGRISATGSYIERRRYPLEEER